MVNYNEVYSNLDDYQKIYVSDSSKIIQVLANAGSGKTHSSIVKILDYVLNKNILPKDIILISYTSKASKVLKQRYCDFFLKSNNVSKENELEFISTLETPWISTIHSFCFNQLNKIKKSYTNSSYNILQDSKSNKILKSSIEQVIHNLFNISLTIESKVSYSLYYLINDLFNANESCYFISISLKEDSSIDQILINPNIDHYDYSYSININRNSQEPLNRDIVISQRIHYYLQQFKTLLLKSKRIPEALFNTLTDLNITNLFVNILKEYLINKSKVNGLSFIDIIYYSWIYNLTYKSIGLNTKVILIDEAQDLDYVNFFTLKSIVDNTKCNLILVGDPKQSLYSFRFADPNILDKLQYWFKEANTCYLVNNYRSNKTLVELSNMFSKSLDSYFNVKPSISIKPAISKCFQYKPFENIEQELEYVASDILLKYNKYKSYKSITILSRTNQSLAELEPYLIKKRIPYKIKYDSNSLINQSAFNLIYNLYSILLNNKDINALLEILEHIKGVGSKSLDKFSKLYLQKYSHFSLFDFEFIKELKFSLKHTDIQGLYDNLIIPIYQYFNSSNFKLNLLNSKIETILNTKFNLMQYTDDNSIIYDSNDSSIFIQLTKDQIYKARITMDSMYDSYNVDYSFRRLLEIEKFQEIVNSLSLTQVEKESNNTDCVLLSTIHGFKGLESDVVYYFNLSSLSPFYKTDKVNDLCVMYVACTRAIQELIITTSLNLRTFDRSYRIAHQNPYLEYYLKCVKALSN